MSKEATGSLFVESNTHTPIMISFAGPTGGVGTTLLAANVGIHLAKKGRSVLLADLALTEAGCHLALGILRPEKHLGGVVTKEVEEIQDVVIPTSVNNLALLAGAPDLPEVANLPYLTKQKILAQLRRLAFDYVLVDAGSGTGADTLDFFLAGSYSVAVMQATPVGVEPFYRFLRAALRRLLMECLNKKRYQVLAPNLDPNSPLSGLWEMEETREEHMATVEEAIKNHRFCFVQTGIEAEKETRLGSQIEALAQRYFLVPFAFLGDMEWDPQAAEACKAMTPIAKAYPMCPYSLDAEKIANVFLKEERDPMVGRGHLTPKPWNELNPYDLLKVPTNATAKEIQAAFPRRLEPFLESSPLTLSLYSKEEREAIRERFEEAYKTLITATLRKACDDDLVERGEMAPEDRATDYGDSHPDAAPGESAAALDHTGENARRSSKDFDAELEEVERFDGPALKRLREARGVSIAEIVEETNIRSWYIESIEAERFEALPGLIYLKGFVRQVASYLGLDADRVLEDYIDGYESRSGEEGR